MQFAHICELKSSAQSADGKIKWRGLDDVYLSNTGIEAQTVVLILVVYRCEIEIFAQSADLDNVGKSWFMV